MRVLPMLQFRSISLHLRAEGLATLPMFARQPKFVLTLLAAYILTLSIASAQTLKKSARKRAVKHEEAAPAPQPPPPPPPPPPLEQMPAAAPPVLLRTRAAP